MRRLDFRSGSFLVFASSPLLLMAAANGEVVMFDNRAASFVWVANGDTTPFAAFDSTRGPNDQIAFDPSRRLSFAAHNGGGSNSIGPAFIEGSPSIRVARNPMTFSVPNPIPRLHPIDFTNVAMAFQPGQVVDASGLYDRANATVGYSNVRLGRIDFIGQHPFIGFRVVLADGLPHFGWTELDRRLGPRQTDSGIDMVLMYQPIRWAYETLPDAPITVVPSPGTLGVLALAGLVAGRRRRGA